MEKWDSKGINWHFFVEIWVICSIIMSSWINSERNFREGAKVQMTGKNAKHENQSFALQ